MTSYKIERIATNKNILKKKIKSDGYHMKPKFKAHDELVDVKEIVIVNEALKEKVLTKQFDIAFRRIFKMMMCVTEDSDSTTSNGDAKIVLSEIVRMKQILKDKYRQNLSKQEYYKMLKKVEILECELNTKIIKNERKEALMFQKMMENNLEEERGRSR